MWGAVKTPDPTFPPDATEQYLFLQCLSHMFVIPAVGKIGFHVLNLKSQAELWLTWRHDINPGRFVRLDETSSWEPSFRLFRSQALSRLSNLSPLHIYAASTESPPILGVKTMRFFLKALEASKWHRRENYCGLSYFSFCIELQGPYKLFCSNFILKISADITSTTLFYYSMEFISYL